MTPALAFPWLAPAILLWGWRCDLLVFAIVAVVALELPRVVPWRLDLALRDFEKLWNATAIIFIGVIFYLLLADRGLGAADGILGGEGIPRDMQRVSGTALTFLAWIPLILLPFLAVHAWSRHALLPWSTFSLYEQARARREPLVPAPTWAVQPMQPRLAYLAVTLFGALVAPDPGTWFMPLWTAVLFAALWPWRSPRLPLPAALLGAGLIIVAAHWSHGIHELTSRGWDLLEQRMQARSGSRGAGELRQALTLHTVGKLQQDRTIHLRGEHPPGRPPGLLMEGSFDRFTGQGWDGGARAMRPITVATAPRDPALVLYTRQASGRTVLALPLASRRVQVDGQLNFEGGTLGAVRCLDPPPLLMWQALPGGTPPSPPATEDTSLERAPADRPAAQRLLERIGREPLATLPRRAAAWLAANGTYSLDQPEAAAAVDETRTPLTRFIDDGLRGHCELFATAAVLALRSAGVPARYAVGWSPSDQGDGTWVARGSDAHAWVLAWDGGRWVELDPTPGGWQEGAGAAQSWWQRMRDGLGWLSWRFDRWRSEGGNWRIIVLIAGLAVLAWIGWRQVRGAAFWRARGARRTAPQQRASPLTPVMAACERRLGGRPAHEPFPVWLAARGMRDDAWNEALALHERLRFDPDGLTQAEERRLAECARRLSAEAGRPA